MSGVLNALQVVSGLGSSSSSVKLGSIVFTGPEVPSEYERGGGQVIKVHRAPGGARIINRMGDDQARRRWSGKLIGQNAIARLRQLEALQNGPPVTWQVVGYSEQVLVCHVVGRIHSAGYVVDYTIEAEVLPQTAGPLGTGNAVLSGIIGSQAAAALSSVTGGIASAASYLTGLAGQAQTVLGQVQPVASLVGLGAPLAHAGDLLTAASAYSQATQGLAGLPSGLAAIGGQIGSAAAGISSTIQGAGSSLLGINTAGINAAAAVASGAGGISGTVAPTLAADAPSLAAATAHAGVLAYAVQSGGAVNALNSTVQQAATNTQPAPLVIS